MTVSPMKTIKTGSGTLDLTPATSDQLQAIAHYWPMEVVSIPDFPDQYGLVFQRGDEELSGIKFQPADVSNDDAPAFHHMCRALIAAALPGYLEKGHRGLMLPCAYFREKPSEKVETGFAFFVGPDPRSRPEGAERSDLLHDKEFGDGATPMIFDMIGAIADASKEHGLPMMPFIGVDVRPRLAIGGLAMHFAVTGPDVVVVKDSVDTAEPVWEYAVRAGFTALPYVALRPVALQEPTPE